MNSRHAKWEREAAERAAKSRKFWYRKVPKRLALAALVPAAAGLGYGAYQYAMGRKEPEEARVAPSDGMSASRMRYWEGGAKRQKAAPVALGTGLAGALLGGAGGLLLEGTRFGRSLKGGPLADLMPLYGMLGGTALGAGLGSSLGQSMVAQRSRNQARRAFRDLTENNQDGKRITPAEISQALREAS